MIVTTELHQFVCLPCNASGTLTTDVSLAEGQDAEHDRLYHSPHTPEGEDA